MRYFTNPYNFIPLEAQCNKSRYVLGQEECLTGYFECTMELLTPLFIPNTSSPQALCDPKEIEKGCCGYEFNSYENLLNTKERDGRGHTLPPKDPVISGSEIRGSIRSVYEAAFGGCMSSIAADIKLGRRSPLNKKPGILRKKKDGSGGYEIVPCKRAMLFVERNNSQTCKGNSKKMGCLMPEKTYQSLREGQKIWIKLADEGYPKKIANGVRKLDTRVVTSYRIAKKNEICPEGYYPGWLHKGEPFGTKKHHESVFYYGENQKAGKSDIKEVGKEEVDFLKIVLEQYQGSKEKSEKEENRYPEFKTDGDRMLVYYCADKGVLSYLSPACIGREVYKKTLRMILEKNGGFEPCGSREKLCPACKVFGMVSGKTGEHDAVGSRVRFTDAVLKHGFYGDVRSNYCNETVLPESGEPRPGAAEFYTISPYENEDAGDKGWETKGYWTYDYMCVKVKQGTRREMLSDSLPMIRGRKYYWHSQNWKQYEGHNNLDYRMKQRIRPIKKSDMETGDRLFCFRVYFDRLNQKELESLRWSLDFADSACAHKLGRGKPLGFGSVKIHIEDLKLQHMDRETGEIKLLSTDFKPLGIDIDEGKEAIKTLKLMANYENIPVNISYPEADDNRGKESFRWFVNNRVGGSGMQTSFEQILPKALEVCGDESDEIKWLKVNRKR